MCTHDIITKIKITNLFITHTSFFVCSFLSPLYLLYILPISRQQLSDLYHYILVCNIEVYINGIRVYSVFLLWLLSLSIIMLRFIRDLCMKVSFNCIAGNLGYPKALPHLVSSFICWWTFELFSVLDYHK